VAQFACEKVLDLGGKPVTFSDSSGFIHDPDGIDREKLAWVKDLKITDVVVFPSTLSSTLRPPSPPAPPSLP